MSKIKLKKLSLQYSYLKLEKEEVTEACVNFEKEIRDYIKDNCPEHFDTLFGPPPKVVEKDNETVETRFEEPEAQEEIVEMKSSAPKNKDVKRVYRKIVELTHPDKIGNNDKADIFHEATEAYNSEDIAELLSIASVLGLDFVDISKDTFSLIEKNVESISQEINTKKKTVAWAWSISGTKEEKDLVLEAVLKSKGIVK